MRLAATLEDPNAAGAGLIGAQRGTFAQGGTFAQEERAEAGEMPPEQPVLLAAPGMAQESRKDWRSYNRMAAGQPARHRHARQKLELFFLCTVPFPGM